MDSKAKATHTPGPWEYSVSFRDGSEKYAIAAPGAWQGPGTSQPWPVKAAVIDNLADAKLIASAPELLAACEQLVANIQGYQDGTALACTLDVEAMERAIAKARQGGE